MSRSWTCRILRHRYKVERLPGRNGDDEAVDLVRCQRCGHEKSGTGFAHWSAWVGPSG